MNIISSNYKYTLIVLLALFASCDKDFNELGSNLIGDDHFDFINDDNTIVIANNVSTGPVQSNNLLINPLGIYKNPALGTTTANFVTQLELGTLNPTFSNIDEPAEVLSVMLTVPLFNAQIPGSTAEAPQYELDSIYGPGTSRNFKLSVYRSGYFLNEIDHDVEGEQQQQRYYSDQGPEIESMIIGSPLNDDLGNANQNSQFYFSEAPYTETTTNTQGTVTSTQVAPAMRLNLNKDFFQTVILEAPAGKLQNNNIFKEYFRGIFFKVEPVAGHEGQLALLDFSKGKITIKYEEDKLDTKGTEVTTDDEVIRIDKTLDLNMAGNTVSLIQNSDLPLNFTAAINQPATQDGVERLYVKGGEGSVVTLDLFGSDGPDEGDVPDQLEELRENNWLINEANLVFYIDDSSTGMGTPNPYPQGSLASEPFRIYLYDIKNRRPLIDYTFDNSGGASVKFSKVIHGGIIEKSSSGRGTQYKIRLTNYIRDLIEKDSMNVKLGLSVTESIAIASMAKLKNENEILNDYVPAASVLNPLGTILYGTSPIVPEDKRLKLQIYYTKPN